MVGKQIHIPFTIPSTTLPYLTYLALLSPSSLATLASSLLTVAYQIVVGVDFGTLNTVIAVARNRGVDVVSALPIP